MSRKSIISTLLSVLFILAMVFLDPKGKVLDGFDKNYERTKYFENCITKDSSETATSTVFHVVDVADGDTIVISQGCKPVTVRLIGIDTPETVDPRKPVQCFGKEASSYTKENLRGKDVSIETDETQDIHDKYGRLLGYVILADGTNFNERLVEEGYAHEYTYKVPYKYQEKFKAAETHARESQRGLWALKVCGK